MEEDTNTGAPAEDTYEDDFKNFGDYSPDDAIAASDEDDDGTATRGSGGSRIFLTDLADTLRRAGLTVEEYDGWRDRAAGRGGFRESPIGIIIHHTASPRSMDGKRDIKVILTKTKDVAAPLSNLYLDRQGKWWVLAAGTTNTNGEGGPLGPLLINDANPRVIGIEAGNRGDKSESWSEKMQDSYVRGVAALADHYGIDSNNVFSHWEWAGHTKRVKIDPAGPSRFGSVNSAGSWDMDKFRAEVRAARGQGGSATTTETTSTGSTSTASTSSGIPDFPGEAILGMNGPIVVAWQEAMIAHGHIRDTVDNHDGDFGGGMQKAVLKMQNSWGWENAVGEAGQQTWDRMHQSS